MIQILVKESPVFLGGKRWVGTVMGFQTSGLSTTSAADAATAAARAWHGDDLERVEETPVEGIYRAFGKGEE